MCVVLLAAEIKCRAELVCLYTCLYCFVFHLVSCRDRAHQRTVPGEAGRAPSSCAQGRPAESAAGGVAQRQTQRPAGPRGSCHRHCCTGASQALPRAAGLHIQHA